MSADSARVAGSVPGKYYVTKQCIGCTLCRETAPGHFRADAEEGYDYVFRQPQTPEEERLCMKAREACPADAIRDDGSDAGTATAPTGMRQTAGKKTQTGKAG